MTTQKTAPVISAFANQFHDASFHENRFQAALDGAGQDFVQQSVNQAGRRQSIGAVDEGENCWKIRRLKYNGLLFVGREPPEE